MERIQRSLHGLRITVALVAFGFGLLTLDYQSSKWAVLGLLLYTLPLVLLALKKPWANATSFFGSLFLAGQTYLSAQLIPGEYLTLTPSHTEVIDVQGDGMPGIQGIQKMVTDARGFRTTRHIEYLKPSPYRVFVMGGSTAEQPYLDNSKTWTHYLQQRLSHRFSKDVEVINTGVSGTRSPHHLLTFRKIRRFHPHLAIFLLGANDWNWHISFVHDAGRPPQEHVFYSVFGDTFFVKNLFLKHSLMGRALSSLFSRRKSRVVNSSVRIDRGEYFTEQNDSLSRKVVKSFRPEDVSKEFRKYFGKILQECRDHGVPCLLMTQPTGYQVEATESVKKRFWMTPPNRGYTLDFDSMIHVANLYNGFIRRETSEQLFPVCDLASELPPDESVFFDDMHFNEAGAKKVGELVFSCVERLGGPKGVG